MNEEREGTPEQISGFLGAEQERQQGSIDQGDEGDGVASRAQRPDLATEPEQVSLRSETSESQTEEPRPDPLLAHLQAKAQREQHRLAWLFGGTSGDPGPGG